MKKTSPAYVLLFMAAVSVVFGVGISAVNYSTRALLEKNELLHRNRVIAAAFMLDVQAATAEAYENAVNEAIEKDSIAAEGRVFEVFRRRGDAPQIGFVFSGLGFWDRIEGIVVVSPDLGRIVNIQIMEQKETPGLGARIEEKWFTDQFKGLTIAWDKPADQRIIVGASANPNAQNRVDAITGASQTSLALMKMLNTELDAFRKAYMTQQHAN